MSDKELKELEYLRARNELLNVIENTFPEFERDFFYCFEVLREIHPESAKLLGYGN